MEPLVEIASRWGRRGRGGTWFNTWAKAQSPGASLYRPGESLRSRCAGRRVAPDLLSGTLPQGSLLTAGLISVWFLSGGGWRRVDFKQPNSLAYFALVRVGIVILFGVCATLLARGFEVGEEAEVWELRPYGQLSKRKHSFVCKCCLNLSDGCKDMLSSRCPCLQYKTMALLRR